MWFSQCLERGGQRSGRCRSAPQVAAEGPAGGDQGPEIGVEIALGGLQRSVTGDDAQDVQGDAGVGHPGQAGVPQAVASQVLVAELGDDLVPVGGVPQDGGGDASAARPGEQAGVGSVADGQEALGDQGGAVLPR